MWEVFAVRPDGYARLRDADCIEADSSFNAAKKHLATHNIKPTGQVRCRLWLRLKRGPVHDGGWLTLRAHKGRWWL